MAQKSVHVTIGNNLPTILSRTLVRDRYAAISEFGCNSYDADANNLHIDHSTLENNLVIKDDGEGMNQKGLEGFFRLGDSEKLTNPISKGGRARVGKYGIATVLLNFLCGSYEIVTWQNGERLTAVEDFSSNSGIDCKIESVKDKSRHGTTITMRDLKFKVPSDEFDLKKLVSRLEWDVPNQPDFNVFVNGELVRKRAVVEYCSQYQVKFNVGDETVNGKIYVNQNRARKLPGIRIYVDGRAVGDPSMFDLRSIDTSLPNQVLGEIHANFLKDSITLDRSKLQEKDDRVRKVKDGITQVLRSIATDMSEGDTRRSFYHNDRKFKKIEQFVESAEEALNARLDAAGLNGSYKIKFDSGHRAGPIAQLDTTERIIYINGNNPMLVIGPKVKDKTFSARLLSQVLERGILQSAAYALATQNQPSEHRQNFAKTVVHESKDFFKGYTTIAPFLNNRTETTHLVPLEEIKFNEYRLYDHQEISVNSGRLRNTVRMLHTSGALLGNEDHLFRAEQIKSGLSKIEGYLSCVEVVDPLFKDSYKVRVLYEEPEATPLDLQLASINNTKNIFNKLGIKNVGITHPFHFVLQDKVEDFRNYAKSEGLSGA